MHDTSRRSSKAAAGQDPPPRNERDTEPDRVHRHRIVHALAALLVAALILATTWMIADLETRNHRDQARMKVLQRLDVLRGGLETSLNRRLFVPRGVANFVSLHPDLGQDEFARFADGLVAGDPAIRVVSLAKDGIISHQFPLAGNEQALGLRLLENAQQAPLAKKAIALKQLVVGGPVDLVQGGTAIICRLPVYLPRLDNGDHGAWWGLCSVVIKIKELFAEAGIADDDPDLLLALRGCAALGPEQDVLIKGSPAVLSGDGLVVMVTLPYGEWTLSGMPRRGWPQHGTRFVQVWGGGALLALLAASLVWTVLRQPVRLRREVDRATDAFTSSQQQLQRALRMEAVGRLAGGVAHDFNNLLTVIIGQGELVARRLGDDPTNAKSVQRILQAAERAANLTRQLLAYGRKQVLAPKVLNLNLLIAEIEPLMRPLLTENVTLVTEFDHELGSVEADPTQAHQVLMNLILNARDAMPQGGTLTIATSNVQLAAPLPGTELRPGPYVVLAVSDTGIGMDGTTLGHLFEPFFTTKSPQRGTGLGLCSSYGIIQQSGGHIAVESAPGRGSTFRIYLPRTTSTPTESKTGIHRRTTSVGAETVLLVEDEEEVRLMAREMLLGAGYKVIEAGDGAEALALVAGGKTTLHLLITDVVMPKLGGVELAKQLAKIYPHLRVLFMSGYTDQSLERSAGLKMPNDFLGKPFSLKVFTGKVRDVLDAQVDELK